eukprot:s5599_g1.t2
MADESFQASPSQGSEPPESLALARSPSGPFVFGHDFTREVAGSLEDAYSLQKKPLGEGSFGSAFRATCKQTGQERAVKAIDISNMKNPTRFQREINIAKKLDHPNVVRLYETFKDARKIYLVMELCTGGELFDRIVDEAPSGFDEAHAAKYIRQILSAICYLHAHRFAHRDVKPENFLFHDPSAESQLKIIDFGLACQFEPGVKMSTKAGTAYYVAPEVLKGGYDEKCDVWSAGVISFVLLCGFPPFAGDKDPEILKKVKTGTFEFRSPEWDPISQGAKNLITQMLTFDPSIRPTAEVVLLSPWLKFKGTPKPAPLSKDFVTRLSGFRAFSKLKKVALTALAQQLPDEKIDGLQKTFRSLDKNGDGTLSVEEIREAIVQQGLNPPKALEDDILQAIDCNGSGSLDYTEFLAATLDQKVYMQRDVCWAAFRIFDLDGDGKITREELGKVLNGNSVQELFGARKIEKMIEEVDKDGDGAVDFEEFCAMMSTKASRPQSAAEAPAKRQRAKSSRGASAHECGCRWPERMADDDGDAVADLLDEALESAKKGDALPEPKKDKKQDKKKEKAKEKEKATGRHSCELA